MLLVTNDEHLPRCLWDFKRIYGDNYIIEGRGVPSNGLVNVDEEMEYWTVAQYFFKDFPKVILDPDLNTWHEKNPNLYAEFQRIHDRYRPLGTPEGPQYVGMNDRTRI